MNIIKLHGTDIETTSLGYGCAGLMRIPSKKRRLGVLSEAYDRGIRHFDVARMYGLGKVEGEVGAFSKRHRENICLATKFGIEAGRISFVSSAIQGVARRVINLAPSLRILARKHSKKLCAPKCFDDIAARRSLEQSLRALQTDYIDIFLLHEPELADVKDTRVLEYLERAKAAGLIRAWGVAGYPGQVVPVLDHIPGLAQVIQVPNDAVNRQLDAFRGFKNSAFITFSPYSEIFDRLVSLLGHEVLAVKEYKAKSGIDLGNPEELMKLLLNYCLLTNKPGVTLFFSSRPENIFRNVESCREMYSEESVNMFAAMLSRIADENYAGRR